MHAPSQPPRPVPRLHVVTDDAVLAAADFVRVARTVMGSGGARIALHVRGPGAGGGTLYATVMALRDDAVRTGAWLVVNDRVDVALTAGAAAVHLGQRSLPVAEAREILGAGARVGVSTHTPEEAARAADEGADWIFVGTTYATPSHPGRAGSGPEGVGRAVAVAGGSPVLAIGGVTPARVPELRAAGAYGVAVVRGVWGAHDPEAALSEFVHALERDMDGTGEP